MIEQKILEEIKQLPVGAYFKFRGWDARKMSPNRFKVKYIGKPAVYIAIK